MNVSQHTLTETLRGSARSCAGILNATGGQRTDVRYAYARWAGAKAYFEDLAFTVGCSREWIQTTIRLVEQDYGL